MFRYADPLACPGCRASLPDKARACPSCGLRLDLPQAYDVFQALQRVDTLTLSLQTASRAAAAKEPAPVPVPAATLPPAPVAPVTPVGSPARPPRPPAMPFPPQPAPTRTFEPATALRGATVPKILLGVGALCLVVAALVFLVVAWSSLGVGGRTAILVAFTLTAAGLAAWSARGGLRAGAESLTVVALGLLLLDLAGGRTAGWFGDLGPAGFSVLAGSVIAITAATAGVATRRTKEPRLISAEIAAALGVLAIDLGFAGMDQLSPAAALAAALGVSGLATVAAAAARLRITAVGTAGLSALAWLGLAGIGLTGLIDEPSWSGQLEEFRVWPLLLAAAVAAALAPVRRAPLPARVTGAAVATFLVAALVIAPPSDEGEVALCVALSLLVAAFAGAAAVIPRPWTWITAAPSALAGLVLGTVSAGVGGLAAFALLAHGLWTRDARSVPGPFDLAESWVALLPLCVAATVLAGSTLVRVTGGRPTALLLPGVAATTASAVVVPILGERAPVAVLAALLVLGTAALVALALRSGAALSQMTAWACAGVTGFLALGVALADDGSTVAVLAALVAALVAAELVGTALLKDAGTWALPIAAGAIAWAIAAMAGLPVEWCAAPVIAVIGALALLRPAPGHDASGLTTALVATFVAASVPAGTTADIRILAGNLTAIAVLAGVTALVRPHLAPAAVSLALFALAALIGWTDTVTSVVVFALATGFAVVFEVRRVAALAGLTGIARVASTVAGAGLVWQLTELAVEQGAAIAQHWMALPLFLVLGAVVLRWPAYEREGAAGVAAALGVLTSTAEPTTVATEALATYLALGAAICTASAVLHADRRVLAWPGLALFGAAAVVALDHPWLQLGILAAFAATCVLHELRADPDLARAGRVISPLAGGALLWVAAGLTDLPAIAQAVPVVVVLGALVVWRAEVEREVPALLAAAVAVAAAVLAHPDQTWVAVYLTLGGVAATASSLRHPTRRRLAWVGLAFFTLAQWLRLEEIGVDTVEAYTLPLAAVLLVVGTHALLTSDRSTFRTLGAGLGLAVVPTLLQVLVDPISLRAVLLGLGCVVLIAVGLQRRWAAPLVAGAGSIFLMVLRQATWAQELPQWALIGLVGVTLTVVGLTWERRLQDVRRAADYVRGLR